jgi:hypothetical protein
MVIVPRIDSTTASTSAFPCPAFSDTASTNCCFRHLFQCTVIEFFTPISTPHLHVCRTG